MTIEDVKKAQKVLTGVIRKTNLLESELTDTCRLYIKPENRQRTGSFKIRGAYYKISRLSEEEKGRGVIACSAGNHAQGVAYAAREKGVRAVICMPENAPRIKVRATRDLGAEVLLVPGTYDDAYEKALALQHEFGYTFVHPFNDEDVMAGQGTIALEILEDLPQTDVILCAVGGGGLLSGIALAAKTLKPDVKVYGVQTVSALGMYVSAALGYVKRIEVSRTMADGIAVGEVGNRTLSYVRRYADDVFSVREEEIADALRRVLCREKLLLEGAGAAPIAAVLSGIVPGLTKDTKVVCVASGGNIDRSALARLIDVAET